MMAKMSKKPRNEVKQRLRVFENNTILLIFSFLAAAAVWFAMMASNSESRATVIRNVPINVEISDTAQEAGVRVFSMSSSATDVSITGNSLITSKVTSEDIGVTATLDPSVSMLTGSSLQQTTLSLRAAKKGNTLAEYEVESVSPSEITVVYDKYKETQLTLETNFQYTTAENYYAPSTPTLSTELITVSGPESSVNKVARAVLEYKFGEELTQSKSLSCKVTLYDANGNVLDPTELYLKLSDDTVEVSIPVTSRQTVKLEADVRNIPDSFASNRITIDPAEIEIAGDGVKVHDPDALHADQLPGRYAGKQHVHGGYPGAERCDKCDASGKRDRYIQPERLQGNVCADEQHQRHQRAGGYGSRAFYKDAHAEDHRHGGADLEADGRFRFLYGGSFHGDRPERQHGSAGDGDD